MSLGQAVVAVTLAFMLINVNPPPVDDWHYLEDCDEICPRLPHLRCQLRCREIIDGRGEDCLNMFFDDNNNRVICYLY